MKVAEISRLLDEPVGACAFSDVADKLLDCRAKARLPQGAATVLVFCYPYRVKESPPVNLSRYAAVPDYHVVAGNRLREAADRLRQHFPAARFEPFMDNSPIPEVYAAVRAGLGVQGRNGLLITPRWGSYVFIGTVVTDLAVEPAAGNGVCIGCGACEKACPVGLDKTRCRSAITQKKGVLTDEEERLLIDGGLVWGCDTCAQVCPMNQNTERCTDPAFVQGYRDVYIPGEDPTGRAYAWRGEAVPRRNAALLEKQTKQNKAETV